MNELINAIFLGSLANLSNNGQADGDYAVVQIDAELGQLYRWESTGPTPDGRRVVSADDGGVWLLERTVTLGQGGFTLLQGVEFTGPRALFTLYPGWRLVSVTIDGGTQTAWLAIDLG